MALPQPTRSGSRIVAPPSATMPRLTSCCPKTVSAAATHISLPRTSSRPAVKQRP